MDRHVTTLLLLLLTLLSVGCNTSKPADKTATGTQASPPPQTSQSAQRDPAPAPVDGPLKPFPADESSFRVARALDVVHAFLQHLYNGNLDEAAALASPEAGEQLPAASRALSIEQGMTFEAPAVVSSSSTGTSTASLVIRIPAMRGSAREDHALAISMEKPETQWHITRVTAMVFRDPVHACGEEDLRQGVNKAVRDCFWLANTIHRPAFFKTVSAAPDGTLIGYAVTRNANGEIVVETNQDNPGAAAIPYTCKRAQYQEYSAGKWEFVFRQCTGGKSAELRIK